MRNKTTNKQTILTEAQILTYLRTNKWVLKPAAIAAKVGLDPGTMSKALNDLADVKGVKVRLPERTLPAISEIILKLQTPTAISETD